MSEDDEGRDHEPSQKKLDDARARGDIPRSPDLTMAAGFVGLLGAVMALGQGRLLTFGNRAEAFLGQIGRPGGGQVLTDRSALGGWIGQLVLPFMPFLLLPGLAALTVLLAQRGLVFSGEKLAPKLGRIDPFASAKQKFGRTGLFEFAKSTVKLLAIGLLLGWFLTSRLPRVLLTLQGDGLTAVAELGAILVEFLILGTLVALIVGMADFGWQQFEFRRRNRMTRQEMMDEYRQSEGDPHMKGQRRQRAQAIAMNRMLADVPRADVVVVNPTHYAVALKWNRRDGRAPVCLAKGTDEIAARIREAAATAGVPIHSDPPTARALYATIEVGREIRPEHYAPVAAAVRYAERMRKRARERRGV